MKKYIKTYIILLTAAISLGTYQYIQSCAGGIYDPDADTHNLISQELIGETPYQPYLFTANSALYGGGEPNSDGSLNAEEWSKYLGAEITPSDLSFFTDRNYNMLNAVSYFETRKFAKHEENNNYYYDDTDSSILSNNIYKVILKNKDNKTLSYIRTLRAIESGLNSNKYWDYQPPDSHKLDSLSYSIKTISLKQKLPKFLKTRYTFLLCKLGFYRENFNQFYPAYQTLKALTKESILLTWCRGYNARFMLLRGQNDSASYEYSRIFVECPEIMHTAFRSFFWCKDKHKSYQAYSMANNWGNNEPGTDFSKVTFQQYSDFAGVQKLLKSPKERADYFGLYINRSYIPVNTQFMETIIQNDPSNEWVDVNMMRGIAQMEYYNSVAYRDSNMSNDLTEFQNFIIKHVHDKDLKRPWLWTLGAGYLCYINGEYDQALQYYKEAEQLNLKDEAFQNQVKILIPLAYLKSQTKITEKEEQQALTYLINLKKIGSIAHADDVQDELLHMLIAKYTQQHEDGKAMGIKNIFYNAEALMSKPRNMNLDSLIAFVESPSKTSYDSICKILNKYTANQLRGLKGGILMGQHQWKNALLEFEFIGDTYEVYANIFKDINLPKYEKEGAEVTTWRIDFCKKMIVLESKIRANKATGEEILLYANASYNLSYWGNSTSFTEFKYKSCFETYRNYYQPEELAEEKYSMTKIYEYPLFKCNYAEEYYNLAAKKSTTVELQAKCVFFAAICNQNNYYISDNFGQSNEDGSRKFVNVYFNTLKVMFKNTNFYAETLKTCSYLDTFDKLN